MRTNDFIRLDCAFANFLRSEFLRPLRSEAQQRIWVDPAIVIASRSAPKAPPSGPVMAKLFAIDSKVDEGGEYNAQVIDKMLRASEP